MRLIGSGFFSKPTQSELSRALANLANQGDNEGMVFVGEKLIQDKSRY